MEGIVRMLRWLFVVVVLSLVAGCGPIGEDDCGAAVAGQLDEVADEWADAVDLASSTSRIALGDRVADLQRIRRAVDDQDWPECAETAKEHLVAAMDGTIDAFQMFMQQEPDREIEQQMERALDDMDLFRDELEAMQE